MASQTLDQPDAGRVTVAVSVKRYSDVVEVWSAWDSGPDGHSVHFEKHRSFCEMMIDEGLQILRRIDDDDIAFRDAVFAGKSDISGEAAILEGYRAWLTTAENLIGLVDRLEAADADGDRGRADAFRKAIADVKCVLTEDAEFFAGDELAELRDAAIDAHRSARGERIGE